MSDLDLLLADHQLTLPPTQANLPCDDGVPMETPRHKFQLDLLMDGLWFWLEGRSDGYVGGNMFMYYSMEQVRNQDFKGPDFFVVLGVPKRERRSWVVWEEGKAPDVVIELLSKSTAKQDKTAKNKSIKIGCASQNTSGLIRLIQTTGQDLPCSTANTNLYSQTRRII